MTFGIDAGLDGVEDVAAGQVDGGGRLPRQVEPALWAAMTAVAVLGTLPRAR